MRCVLSESRSAMVYDSLVMTYKINIETLKKMFCGICGFYNLLPLIYLTYILMITHISWYWFNIGCTTSKLNDNFSTIFFSYFSCQHSISYCHTYSVGAIYRHDIPPTLAIKSQWVIYIYFYSL